MEAASLEDMVYIEGREEGRERVVRGVADTGKKIIKKEDEILFI